MKARIAGAAVVAVLLALIAVDAVRIARNWSAVRTVSTPTGSPAPDFDLPFLDGGRIHLAETRGSVVVLAFWATWCEPCRAELPQLDRLKQKLTDVRFYAVNIETLDRKSAIGEFRSATHLTLPIVLDGGPASETYHVETIPHLVVLGRDGRVRSSLDGTHSMNDIEAAILAAGR